MRAGLNLDLPLPFRLSLKSPRARLCLWSIVAVAASVAFLPEFVSRCRTNQHRDFEQEWLSARNWLNGFPVYENQSVSLRRYLGDGPKPGQLFVGVNAHPPSSILLGVPLAGMSYPDAFLAWNLISLLALGVSGAIITVSLGIRCDLQKLLCIYTLVLSCAPLHSQMDEGQLNLVLLALIVGVWAADRGDRPELSGLLLGVATVIKLFPGFLFLYFVLRRRWRAVTAGVISVVALTLVSILALGFESYRDYVVVVMPTLSTWRSAWGNLTLLGIWSKLFDPEARVGFHRTIPLFFSPLVAWSGTLVCDLALIALLSRLVLRARSRADRDLAFALCLPIMVLISPVAWNHYLVLLPLPIVVLWTSLPATGPSRWDLRVLVLVLWLSPKVWWSLFIPGYSSSHAAVYSTPWGTLTALSIPTYAVLGLVLLGVSTAQPEDGATDAG